MDKKIVDKFKLYDEEFSEDEILELLKKKKNIINKKKIIEKKIESCDELDLLDDDFEYIEEDSGSSTDSGTNSDDNKK
jgi:hypothetical protein